MKEDIKQEWVKRLRSGKYVQGTGFLVQDHTNTVKHCCLGVLGEIYAEHTGDQSWRGDADGAELPSDAVVEWAGLPNSDPNVCGMCLSSRNDSGETFSHIADLIEDHL